MGFSPRGIADCCGNGFPSGKKKAYRLEKATGLVVPAGGELACRRDIGDVEHARGLVEVAVDLYLLAVKLLRLGLIIELIGVRAGLENILATGLHDGA